MKLAHDLPEAGPEPDLVFGLGPASLVALVPVVLQALPVDQPALRWLLAASLASTYLPPVVPPLVVVPPVDQAAELSVDQPEWSWLLAATSVWTCLQLLP